MVLKERVDTIQTNTHLSEHKFRYPFVDCGKVLMSCEHTGTQARGDREPLL